MKIYWVRHGKTEQNVNQNYYGKLDARLTPEGIQEVKSICTNFDDCINVYMSPAARAVETASLLFQGIYFNPDSRLLERNMGIFEGMSDRDIKAKYPKEREEWYKDWRNYVIPDGESATMQYERVRRFIQEREREGKDAIVVCHAGTIRMALSYMLGENLDMFWKFKVDTGIVVTTTFEERYWYIEMARKYY